MRGIVAALAGIAGIAVVAPCGAVAGAQVVRVRAVEAGSQRPVNGAVVSLLDGEARRVSPVLADAGGQAVLRAPAAGSYRVVVERVGYARWTSPAHALAAGDTVDVAAALPVRRTELAAVAVRGTTECATEPAAGTATAMLWEEVRKALEASELTRSQQPVPLDVRRFERQLDRALRVQAERESTRRLVAQRPFRSPAAAELLANGYVRPSAAGDVFAAPDAHVLLSDGFVRTHCFAPPRAPARGERAGADVVGLDFRPVPSRRVPDVAGTIWVDRASAELRAVDYRYVNVPTVRGAPHAGGQLAFRRLDDGRWIVERWHIRMPRRGVIRPTGAGSLTAAERDTLLGYREEGGVATPAAADPAPGTWRAPPPPGDVAVARRRPTAGRAARR